MRASISSWSMLAITKNKCEFKITLDACLLLKFQGSLFIALDHQVVHDKLIDERARGMDMGLARFPMLCRDLFVIGGDRRQREV